MIDTSNGKHINQELLHNYFKSLVNHFFKILPMRESEEASLSTYMESLQVELLGCQSFIPELSLNPDYLTLLGILQYLIDNPNTTTKDVRREVFRSISICNKLKLIYSKKED